MTIGDVHDSRLARCAASSPARRSSPAGAGAQEGVSHKNLLGTSASSRRSRTRSIIASAPRWCCRRRWSCRRRRAGGLPAANPQWPNDPDVAPAKRGEAERRPRDAERDAAHVENNADRSRSTRSGRPPAPAPAGRKRPACTAATTRARRWFHPDELRREGRKTRMRSSRGGRAERRDALASRRPAAAIRDGRPDRAKCGFRSRPRASGQSRSVVYLARAPARRGS